MTDERSILKKEFEENVNDIIVQFALYNLLFYSMGALGIADQSTVWQSIYENLVDSLDALIQEIVAQMKSTDAFAEIIAMFKLLQDLGFWLDNVTTWLASGQTRDQEISSIQDAMALLQQNVEEFHSFMEELDVLLSPEMDDKVEPNNPSDE